MARTYRRSELAQELFKKNPQLSGTMSADDIVDAAIKKNPELSNRIVYTKKELAENLFKKNPQLQGQLNENQIIERALKVNPALQSRIIEPRLDLRKKFVAFGEKLKGIVGKPAELGVKVATGIKEVGIPKIKETTVGLKERVKDLFAGETEQEKKRRIEAFKEFDPFKEVGKGKFMIPKTPTEQAAAIKAVTTGLQIAAVPAAVAGLVTAPVSTALAVGGFVLLDRLIPAERFIPTNATDTKKALIELADFVAKGFIVGGAAFARGKAVKAVKGTRAYKNLTARLKLLKTRKLSKEQLGEIYKTATNEIKREMVRKNPKARKWFMEENLRASGMSEAEIQSKIGPKLLEFKPKIEPKPQQAKLQPVARPEPDIAPQPKQEAKIAPPDILDAARARLGIAKPKPTAKPTKLTKPIEIEPERIVSEPVEFKAEPIEITKPEVVTPKGKFDVIKTGRGTTNTVQWAVMPAGELLASNKTNLAVNPDYPKALQPRQRTRAASELQISGIINNLDPALLGENILGGLGAPIVTPEGVVVSGNARSIALKRIYEQGLTNQAETYKKWLADNSDKFGIPRSVVKNIDNPVLVRITETKDNQLVKLASELNEPTVQVMSASERALEDARKIDPALVENLAVDEKGNLDTLANRQFINDFASKVIPPSELSTFIDPDGFLSQEGSKRLMASVFAKTYQEPQLVKRLIESNDNQIKAVVNGMRMSAPKLLKLRTGVAEGNLYPLDIVENINEAARILADLRKEGTSVAQYLKQPDMFSQKPSAETLFLLEIFGNKRYIRSPEKIRALMVDYASEVEALGNPNQLTFTTAETPSKLEMLKFATEKGQQTLFTNQALAEPTEQAGIFAEKAFEKIKDTKIDKLPNVSQKLINEVRDTSTGTEGFVLNPLPNSSRMTQEGAGGGKESVKAWQDINKNLASHMRNDYKDLPKGIKNKSIRHKVTQALFDNAFILWGKGKMPSKAYSLYRTKGSRQLALYNNFKRGFFDILKQLRNKKELKLGQAIYLNKFYAQSARIGKQTSKVTEKDALKANEILRNENPETYDRIESVMDQLAKYTNERGLGLLKEFDVVPEVLLKAWMERMPNYVSARALDASLDHAFGLEGGDAVSRLTGGFLKLRSGHDYEIETDLLKNVMNSVREKIVYSTNIETLREIVKNPDWAVEIGELQAIKGNKKIPDMRVHPTLPLEDLDLRQFEGGARVKRSFYRGVKKPQDFINLNTAIDGKIYAVDPDVYRLLQIGNKNSLGVIGDIFKGFNRVFQMSATALRFAFGLITNPQRDIFTMLLNLRSKEGGGTKIKMSLGRYARATWESARASLGIPSEFAKKAINNGILRASLVYTPRDVKMPFRFLTVGQQAGRILKAPVIIPWKVLVTPAEALENAPKFAEFKRLEDVGYIDTLPAITMARRVNADFDVHGGKTQALRNLLVFFNPMLQGHNVVSQTAKAQPWTTAKRAFKYGFLPIFMLYLWNRTMPGEELIDDWIKDNYFYLNTGMMYKNAYGNKVPVLVTWSKAEWQKILNPILWMIESWDKKGKGKSEFDTVGSRLYDNLMQWGSGFVPPIIRSGVEVNIGDPGYSFYTRGPIVPPGREKLEPKLRFRPSDSIGLRVLAERMGVSPAKFTHFVRSNLPAIMQLEEILNYVLRNKVKLPGVKKERLPEKIARGLPIIKIPSGFKVAQEVEKGFAKITEEKESAAMQFLYLLKEAVMAEKAEDAQEWMERAIKAAQQVPAKRRGKIIEQVQKGVTRKQIPIELRSFMRQAPAFQAEFFKRYPKTAERVFKSQQRKIEQPKNDILSAVQRRLGITP